MIRTGWGSSMRVHFIDTTILLNILDIPFMNQDREKVLEEYQRLTEGHNHMYLLASFMLNGASCILYFSIKRLTHSGLVFE